MLNNLNKILTDRISRFKLPKIILLGVLGGSTGGFILLAGVRLSTSDNTLSTLLASGLGAFGGGAGAYLLGLAREERQIKEIQIEKILHAQSCLVSQYNSILVTRLKYLDNFKGDQHRYFMLNKSIGIFEGEYFKVNEISFLFSTNIELMQRITIQQNNVKLLFLLIIERNRRKEKLSVLLNKITGGNDKISLSNFEEAFQKDRPMQADLISLTDAIYSQADSVLEETYAISEELRSVAKEKWLVSRIYGDTQVPATRQVYDITRLADISGS